ncbi:hypothetical protein KDA_23670 [Dictyobacter alpinus]|uniref:DUF3037 domain-containing protein n=1 Tax=Dictyobacter alpinus TaxID=2014873 RepID=A0A402B693_9CHLR|nr:DUF3037 domain-containing protein [Dictyobacter alpinus]GCE26883.1 hypothetical protein KDA_23670 [Dictyobacter alpinus]
MPATSSYDYAIIRVVPRVDRGECINVGVILYCRTRRFLGALIHVDEARLQAFAPTLDLAALQIQLHHFLQVCEGKAESGPVGQLSQSERFQWLVAPRSATIQLSPVHSGLCQHPEQTLHTLMQKLVL